MAVVLYVDMPIDEYEDAWQSLPEVVALDRSAGLDILGQIKGAVDSGHAVPLTDRAASALSLLLSTGIEWQSLLAPMLEGIAGKPPIRIATGAD
jgi:hypothetical protein